MKKFIWGIFFACLFAGCKKEGVFDELGFYGEGAAQLNGQSWRGKTGIFPTKNFCEPDTCIAITFLYHNQHEELRGDITFDDVPLKRGRKKINYVWPTWDDVQCRLIYSRFAADGDVLVGEYHIVEQNDENFLEITELNLKTGDVKGKFQATVVRDSLWTPPGHKPDTIKIMDGSFFGKIFWK